MAQTFVERCSRGVIDAEPCPRKLGREILPAHRHMVLTTCVLASSMAFIDATALPVALPRLRADFGADLASVQWALNGYMLALASLTLIGGARADVYGKARMLALGCILFGLASAACALAPSPALLIAARVVQGAAAAIFTPASLALIGATYPRAERKRAIGVWAAGSALTTAGGPVLGDRENRLAVRVLDQPAARAHRSGNSAGLRARRWPHPAQVRRGWSGDPRLCARGARLGAQPDRSRRSSSRRGLSGADGHGAHVRRRLGLFGLAVYAFRSTPVWAIWGKRALTFDPPATLRYGGLVKRAGCTTRRSLSPCRTTGNAVRRAEQIFVRPAVARCRKVDRTSVTPSSQLHERHEAKDVDTGTQDKLIGEHA